MDPQLTGVTGLEQYPEPVPPQQVCSLSVDGRLLSFGAIGG